jgi:aminoglycoside phosphotransferase (APT) family kinase protein
MTDLPAAHDLDRLATALERRFATLQPVRPLRVLGRGFRSVALETAGGAVLRVGLSADAADNYAKEWRIGRFLASSMGAILPEPLWYASPCDELPHGALGYRKLDGSTPAWGTEPGAAFAGDLGAFMARLHALPVDDARAAGVPEVDSYRRVLRAREVVMPLIRGRLEPGQRDTIERWWAGFAADERMSTTRVAVCHHDLWHDNLLQSAGRLTGVLDIAHVEVSDPAHDFAAPRYFGDGFMAALIAAYRAACGHHDAEDAYRAARFYEAREFGGLAWAIEHDDAYEVEDAVRKIINGPILRGG